MSMERNDEADRPWQEVAAELTKEQDPEKVVKLSSELNKALDKNSAELPRPGSEMESPRKAS